MKSLHLDSRLPHPYLALLLIATFILAVYYPTITSGIHSIDDPGIVSRFTSPPSLTDIFLPGKTYYFRPIIELSFYLDSRLWGMEPLVMHLENVLLHIVNTLFIFLISRKIANFYPASSPYIPVLAALIFAFHPLNVEAISWIAGRTDPLAAVFILSSCFFWLCWLETAKWQQVVCATLLFVLGVLTKESSLAFIPVALLILFLWPDVSKKRRQLATGGIVASVVVVVLIFTMSWKSGVVGLGRFFAQQSFGVSDWCRTAGVAFGFYVKKLLMPLPLNFAITEVSQWYGLVGIIFLLSLIAAIITWRFSMIYFAATALMILPSLIVAIEHIAWTPYAERYMYMPTAFLCLGISNLLYLMQENILKLLVPLIVILVCIAGGISYQRNLLWKNKKAFYLDAVHKSPGFGSLYNELGVILLQESKISEAVEAFTTADRLNSRSSLKFHIQSNIMAAMVAQGNYAAAREYFFKLCSDKKVSTGTLLEILYAADSKRLETLKHKEKIQLAYDLLETLELLHHKKPDPFWLYRSGQIALIVGEKEKAAVFFRKAYTAAPTDAFYKDAAKTIMLRLEAGK